MRPLLLLLLATAHGLDTLKYKPILAKSSLGGLVTGSTFVLEQPRCIFEDNTASIWLVVATAAGKEHFNDSAQPGMPEWSFQRFPTNTSSYLTLGAMWYHYPCLTPSTEITVLRVGSETSCVDDTSVPNCNGPLPNPGPFWVKFLALNASGPVATTQWSEPIELMRARPIPSSSGAGGGRSGAMITITAILSVLLAVLLAALLATLCSSEACGVGSFRPDAASIRRYNTHHVYEQQAARL
ncbi:uroplakin-3b-like protein 1 [Excalfactoria chinensis]|uniref:uroplakin-3b-like protein 1 n=1 Tax=Excalfactoria chinensis TaxID=46218 RepID=UPI003B3B3CC5